jgi:hypothetical protein
MESLKAIMHRNSPMNMASACGVSRVQIAANRAANVPQKKKKKAI